MCSFDSLGNSDANIVSNFQADIRRTRMGNRDLVQWFRTWVQGEGSIYKVLAASRPRLIVSDSKVMLSVLFVRMVELNSQQAVLFIYCCMTFCLSLIHI